MLNNNSKVLIISALALLSLASCKKDDAKLDIENPANYEFLRDGVSTVSFSGQTARLGMATELTAAMEDFDSDLSTLIEMYANETATGGDANPYADAELNNSTKSVKSKVAASIDLFSTNSVESSEIKADLESWIEAQVTEVYPNQNVLAAPGQAGQIGDNEGARYVSAQGLEYNQAVSKSLIGALITDQILNNYLSTAVLDEAANVENNNTKVLDGDNPYTTMEHKWDEAYGYLFGAATSDASDPLSTLGNDLFLNKYLSRVNDDADFAGIANHIFEAFKLGRAAIVANDYDVRDEQIEILKTNISAVIAVRAIYYLQQAKIAMAGNNFGGAFHDLSEGLGFVYSLRFLRDKDSDNALFTKSEVDGYIAQLTAGNGFWDVNSETLDAISESIADKFDFTVTQAGS